MIEPERSARFTQRAAGGFTLIEIAVALFVVTLLLGAVFIPLQTQVESRKLEETRRALEQAREALLGFASSFGYFPCPATAASNGLEPAGPPGFETDHAWPSPPKAPPPNPCGSGDHGFLPGALLGLTSVDAQGFALDAWGSSDANRIRYAVSNHTVAGVVNVFTRSGGMAAAGVPSLGAENNLFHICASGAGVAANVSCAAGQTLASNAVVVLWSVGPNARSGGTNAHEAENPNPNGGSADRIFVSRARSTVGGAEFDDSLVWIPTFTVISRMVASGQLP